MDDVATMEPGERRDLFNEAAALRGDIAAEVMEKDFWVCWTLKHIFALGPAPAQLIFKGGTSLSKVYGVIERFSEDIDLSLSREDLGFSGDRDPYKQTSNKKKQAIVGEIEEACREAIKTQLLPRLRTRFESALSSSDKGTTWKLESDPTDWKKIYFTYPGGIQSESKNSPNPYVRRIVFLELGARSDHWPAEEHTVRPYAADVLPQLFKEPECRVRTLGAERTFWEKVTLLHAEAHRPLEAATGDRLSRHYYDVAKLYQHSIGANALANRGLLASVVAHKSLFFRSRWASYEKATAGTFRIVPPLERHQALKADYEIMRQYMIFGESYTFDELIALITEVQVAVNTPDQSPTLKLHDDA